MDQIKTQKEKNNGWYQTVDIRKHKAEKKLQEITINQSWIKQAFSGHTDIGQHVKFVHGHEKP